MSTTRPRAQAQAQPVAQLPLGLQPFHVLYVSLVVAIVFGGTLYSLWSGSHVYNSLDGFDRLDVLSEASSSSPTAHSSFLPPTSYLADKRNVFNQIFVKRAWAWNTLAFIVQALILKSSSGGGMAAALKKKDDDAAGSAQANAAARTANASKATATKQSTISSPLSISFLRFGVATACWVLFAGWFFGPPLMLRVLEATGGKCVPENLATTNNLLSLPEQVETWHCYQRRPITRTSHPHLFPAGDMFASRVAASGGIKTQWRGGHDISGHTFILSLSILYLLEELSPFVPYLLPVLADFYPRSVWWPSNPFASIGAAAVSTGSSASTPLPRNRVNLLAAISLLALVGLWSFMLLTTQIYFHTAYEKITGLITALGAWLLLPKQH